MDELGRMINRCRKQYEFVEHNLPMPGFMALVRYCTALTNHDLYCNNCQIVALCDFDMDIHQSLSRKQSGSNEQ